jgi:Domain of unknown function (DUF4352)
MYSQPPSDQPPSDQSLGSQPTQRASQPPYQPQQPYPQYPTDPQPYSQYSGQPLPYQPPPPPPPPYPSGPTTQWQQMPYQPPPQVPYQPMPPQMPPRRSGATLWIVLGIIVVVLVASIIGGAVIIANGSKNNVANNPPGSTPGVTATTAPGQTPPASNGGGPYSVGATVNYNNDWQITINGVSSYQGDPNQFDPTPEPGHTFLVLEGTFKNLQSSSQPLSTLVEFELRDSQGNKYDEGFLPSLNLPDGTIVAGGPAHGKWGYDVPTSVHTFTLLFSEDFGQTSVIWNITL